MSDEEKLSETEIFFSALADKTRLRLLNLMRDGEICVCFFVDVLREGQPKVSRHLAYLRNAGIVETRRNGKLIYYKIAAPKNDLTKSVLRETLASLALHEKMRGEYEKLLRVCGESDISVETDYAPSSKTSVNTNMNARQNRELETFLL
jgi:ArsR family transcriptional regulator